MSREARIEFDCFGGECVVAISGRGAVGEPEEAVATVRDRLLSWHDRFTRFSPDSELSRLNAAPTEAVEVTPVMGRFVRAVIDATERTGGLVDATLLPDIEAAGYRTDLGRPLPLGRALARAPARRPARPRAGARWEQVTVEHRGRLVRRPPGLGFDSGGLVKGMLADVLAPALATHDGYALVLGGDLRVGTRTGRPREVRVASPFDGSSLHAFALTTGAAATSGIGRRSWIDDEGRPAHHLLDPATGTPAFTGIVQATAVAPTALEAEIRAKAAVLSGPDRADAWLPGGGVLVFDDARHAVVPGAGAPLQSAPGLREHRFAWARPRSSTPISMSNLAPKRRRRPARAAARRPRSRPVGRDARRAARPLWRHRHRASGAARQATRLAAVAVPRRGARSLKAA